MILKSAFYKFLQIALVLLEFIANCQGLLYIGIIK